MLRTIKPNRGSKNNSLLRKRLHVEALEARRLLAGDVSVNVVDGDLQIRGDQLSNLVELHQAHDGTSALVIRGLVGEDGDLTTVNGQESVRIEEAFKDLVANMRNGDDLIYIHDVDLPGNLLVRSGRGNDTVLVGGLPRGDAPLSAAFVDDTLVGDDGVVAPGVPIDPVPIDPSDPVPVDPVPILPVANVTIAGSARVVTGGGDDGVAMGSVEVRENLLIRSGSHNDVLRLGVNTLPGPADDVAFSVIDGSASINLPVDVFGSLSIDAGTGDDQAWLESVHVARNMRTTLGAGDDLFSYDWGGVSGRIIVDGGRGDDIVALAHVTADTLVIRMRGGSDGVGLAGVSVGRLHVDLGSGDDQMIIADTSAQIARLNGKAGIDSLEFQGSNHLPSLRLLNFEIIT